MAKLLAIAFLALPLAGCGTIGAGFVDGFVGSAVTRDAYYRQPYEANIWRRDEGYWRRRHWHRRGWY